MAAFIAICGVPKGCVASGMLAGMVIGTVIGTPVAIGAGEVLIGAGASTGEGEGGVVGEAATAHGGGSGPSFCSALIAEPIRGPDGPGAQ